MPTRIRHGDPGAGPRGDRPARGLKRHRKRAVSGAKRGSNNGDIGGRLFENRGAKRQRGAGGGKRPAQMVVCGSTKVVQRLAARGTRTRRPAPWGLPASGLPSA